MTMPNENQNQNPNQGGQQNQQGDKPGQQGGQGQKPGQQQQQPNQKPGQDNQQGRGGQEASVTKAVSANSAHGQSALEEAPYAGASFLRERSGRFRVSQTPTTAPETPHGIW